MCVAVVGGIVGPVLPDTHHQPRSINLKSSASVDAATCATALALAFVTARWRAATRERRRWRDEARRLDEANQELEWRLRVATAESDGADDLRRRRSTPRARPASAPATSPPTDARDVLVDGLRAETEALRAALAQARAAQK